MVTDGLNLYTILQMLEIVSILGGGGVVAFKLGKVTSKFEGAMAMHSGDIAELKNDVKMLNGLLTEIALQKQRLDEQSRRLNVLDDRYEELRHGEGFVIPFPGRPSKV